MSDNDTIRTWSAVNGGWRAAYGHGRKAIKGSGRTREEAIAAVELVLKEVSDAVEEAKRTEAEWEQGYKSGFESSRAYALIAAMQHAWRPESAWLSGYLAGAADAIREVEE